MLFYVEPPMLLRSYVSYIFLFTYAMDTHQRDKLLTLARFTWQIWYKRCIQWPREYLYGEWYVIIRLSVTPPQKLDISKMLKWYWHHSSFVSVKYHFYKQQRSVCLTVSCQCIAYSLICTGADTFENIQLPQQ